MKATAYAAHPAADLYPMLPEDELRELAEDIKRHGQRHAVIVLGDLILDGRNRALACDLAGVEPRFEQYEGPTDTASLLAYVRSLNLSRRHLTTSQRALIAARAIGMYEDAARERMAAGGRGGKSATPSDPEKARDQAGTDYRVSGRSVSHAKTVLEKGTRELVAAVERGEVAVSTGAELARLSKDSQVRILKSTKGDPHALREAIRAATAPPSQRMDPAAPPGPASRPRPPQTILELDGEPGPEDETWTPPGEGVAEDLRDGSAPGGGCTLCYGNGAEGGCPACDREQLTIDVKAPRGPDPRGGRLPPGTGAGFGDAPPPKAPSWREVLGLTGNIDAGAIVQRHRLLLRDRPEREHADLDRALAQALSQWNTMPEEADLLVDVALRDLRRGGRTTPYRILEPSAGTGVLVRALLRHPECARLNRVDIRAVEVDTTRATALAAAPDMPGPAADPVTLNVHAADFLTLTPPGTSGSRWKDVADVAIMNPPYEGGLDGRFLEHALLHAQRVVALVRLNALTGSARWEQVWSRCQGDDDDRHDPRDGDTISKKRWNGALSVSLSELVILRGRPSFEGPGDFGARSDYAIVCLKRSVAPRRLRPETVVRWA